jgi:pyruvate dehydrogenase E1 component alpha subunit
MAYTKQEKLQMYHDMVRVRKFEEHASAGFFKGIIPGFVHVGIGEEAVSAGIIAALRGDDYLFTTHRQHGMLLLRSSNAKRMMAELAGKVTGFNRGKGGSQHVSCLELGLLGSNGILGATQVLSAGSGLSAKMRGTGQVTVCMFGDGASNEGTFHEGLNFISAKKLPVVYCCVNNLYGISGRQDQVTNVKNLADRALAYNIPGAVVDGNDVMAVRAAMYAAAERARAGEGPSLLEMKTYRWHGHSEGNRPEFRPEEELAHWKSRCPIKAMKKELTENEAVSEGDLLALEEDAEKEMRDAIQYAVDSPDPAIELSLEDVYTDIVEEGKAVS